MSNCLLIYQYSSQPIHTQIFNKNPPLILSLIDHEFESAVNLWSICSYADPQQKSAIDLITQKIFNSNLRSTCSQPAHTQILNKNLRLILSLIDLQLASAVNLFIYKSSTKSAFDLFTYRSSIGICDQLVHTQILNKNPRVIFSLMTC